MTFRRRILASLAPLLRLSAILAAMAAHPREAMVPASPGISSLVHLLRSVVQLATPASDYSSVSARSERPSPQAVLPFSALAGTPLHGSVWMLARRASAPHLPLYLQHAPLRC